MTTKLTIRDLGTCKISGAKNTLMLDLRDEDEPSVYVVSDPGGNHYAPTGLISLVAAIDASTVETSLSEWLTENADDLVEIAECEDPEERDGLIHDFAEAIGTAYQYHHIGVYWTADDYFTSGRDEEITAIRKAGGVTAWATDTVAEAQRAGVWLDLDDCKRWAAAAIRGKMDDFGSPVLVETMPEYLRASHEAAGNRGAYPHNGAERVVCAEDDVDPDDGWTTVIRPATEADLLDYGWRS